MPPRPRSSTELGGGAAASVAAVAQDCETIVLAVFSTDQVEDVVERELLPALGDASGRIVLCASTCDPDRIARLARELAARGLRLLETPVSGSSGQVARGEGIALVGGDRDVLAAVEPLSARAVCRPISTSARSAMAAAPSSPSISFSVSTGWRLPRDWCSPSGSGLDRAAFLDVARRSAAYSQVMDVKGGKMVRGDFAPEGRVTQHLKDVHLMLEQAARVQQELPLLAVHAEMLEACVRHGEGDLDNSIVIEEIRRRTSSTGDHH